MVSIPRLFAVVALAASALTAQVQKGGSPPELTFDKIWNEGLTSWDDLAGKVVLLDFSQTWCGPCKAAVPKLNELYKKYSDRGLLVIGVSDEDDKKIEDIFINQVGVKFPFVKSKGSSQKYGIKFFPSVFCIDPKGVVFSVADDRMPSEEQLEGLLQQVSLAPKMPDGAAYEPIKAMWEKRDFLKLRDFLGKQLAAPNLNAEMRTVLEKQQQELEKRIAGAVERAERLSKGPDYLAASEQLAMIEKDWKGLPPAAAARRELDHFQGDAAIKKEITASKAWQKLLATHDANKRSGAKALQEELPKFQKKYEGTHAAGQAGELLRRLGGG